MSRHDHAAVTRAAAYGQARESRSQMHQRILDLLRRAEDGLTRHEIADRLAVSLQTVCGRCSELKSGGLVREVGRREVRGGRTTASVLAIAPPPMIVQQRFDFGDPPAPDPGHYRGGL